VLALARALRLAGDWTAEYLLAEAVTARPQEVVYLLEQAKVRRDLRGVGWAPATARESYRAARLLCKDLGVDMALSILLEGDNLPVQGEAKAVLQELIERQPERAALRFYLGLVLAPPHLDLIRGGRFQEAAAAYREATRIKPDFAEAHCNLGLALRDQGRLPEAVAALQETISLQSNLFEAHYQLGLALRALGKLPEAQPIFELDLAARCRRAPQGYHASAGRFYALAFAAKSALADDLAAGHRYQAANSAAQAGCGYGFELPAPDDRERARLRRQALDWLRADLTAWAKEHHKGPPLKRLVVQQALARWQADIVFRSVRDEAGLARLPEAEREEWRKLWADVADLLRKVRAP
jgi:Flp pilus assembly protein TadD